MFVDAGYLYAGTGRLLFKTRDRRAIRLDVPGVNGLLNRLAEEGCRLPPLRTYWYDGARGGTPTAEQQRIAALPDVKLRLGRITTKNQQKGVDALILLDLVALARERAISEAYLLSGDEDLREGVRAAQDLGVRVTLIGIPTSDGSRNQSRELVNEADKSVMLNKDDLEAWPLAFNRGKRWPAAFLRTPISWPMSRRPGPYTPDNGLTGRLMTRLSRCWLGGR